MPPNSTQSQNNMSIWTLSRYVCRLFMGFPLGVLAIVAKETMVDGIIPELTIFVLVTAVGWF